MRFLIHGGGKTAGGALHPSPPTCANRYPKQLAEILQARLAEANSVEGNANASIKGKAFDNGAINMAAAKVASSSGDMRMCLKYCRRAIEVPSTAVAVPI